MKAIRNKLKIVNNNNNSNLIGSITNKKQQLPRYYKNKRLKSKSSHFGINQSKPITRSQINNKNQNINIQLNK